MALGKKLLQMALPNFKLNVSGDALAPLAQTLHDLGYNEALIRSLFSIHDTSELLGKELPFYQWSCRRDPRPAAKMVGFFLLGEAMSKESLIEILGERMLAVLMKCGAVVGFSGIFTCQVVLYPFEGRFFFTDFWFTKGHQDFGKIYELGTDSYVLARVTPRKDIKKALDLCTGSGVHAILSAAHCPSSAVDINPRALEYTLANCALNSVHCDTHLGDLYSALDHQERYDLITANPPFVPSPDTDIVLIHRSPGETGEEVSEKIVAGLPERLTDRGLFSMILEFPVIENDDYADRLERWLGQEKGWGIAVLWYLEKDLAEYVVQHIGPVDDYDETFQKYLESYQKNNIRAIRFASVFIKRLSPDCPNWKTTEKTLWPKQPIAEQMDDWLTCLSQYHDPNWQPDPQWKPKLSRYYKSVWRDWDDARGVLEMSDDNWIQPPPLDADETELLMRLKNGDRSITELKKEWTEDLGDEVSFLKTLRAVGLRRALE